MGNIKIPFGWHTAEGKWKDPGSVPRGLACGCYCHDCKEPLQAVHPRRLWRANWIEKYFRHSKGTICKGALESLLHRLAKEVLERDCSVFLPDGAEFFYDTCKVETSLEGKRPDIYLINSRTGERMVVEIFYSHRMDESTLAAFREKELRVMEIDISSMRTVFPSMEVFEWMVLKGAPRKFLWVPEVAVVMEPVYSTVPVYSEAPVYSTTPNYAAEPTTWLERVMDWWRENWLWVLMAVMIIGILLYRVSRSKPVVAQRGKRRQFGKFAV